MSAKENNTGSVGLEPVSSENVEKLDRLKKLEDLRKRMQESSKANRLDVFAEHQRNNSNPKFLAKMEKKRLEAERLQERMNAEERGEDYERKRFWEYSAESVEKWEEKQEEKRIKSDIAFTDFGQVAEKKYNKNINKLKPNLGIYNNQKKAIEEGLVEATTKELAIASDVTRDGSTIRFKPIHPKPSTEALDRLVGHVKDEIAERAKFSRVKPIKEEDDVTYINDRNAHFNRKISRAFDKYTKEIKDSFERGTAL